MIVIDTPQGRPTQRLTGGALVYAVGDIHGRYDLFKTLLKAITNDYASRAAGRRPILIFCGDYVDRGPQSAEVLDGLIWLLRRGDIELHLLKGNHEQAMLEFIDRPLESAGWLRFGGLETLISYGVEPPAPDEPDALIRARDVLLTRMPAGHLLLLQRLKTMVLVGDYIFVHAGIRPGVALAKQTERDLLWIRGAFLTSNGPHEKVVVHGHTWADDQPQLLDHRLGLDTGAYATGVLTAVRLDDRDMAVLQTHGEPAQNQFL